ncbi:MAG TPA: ABC transporter permease [Solirubrobacteraceae bacterium]|nr:ABC transporter permease [Solirubrobacteraceae bacterium]
MSAAGAPAAALPAHRRRPSTATVYAWELRKLARQKRAYVGFFLAALVPVIFVVSQGIRGHHGHGQAGLFLAQVTQSGLATPVVTLIFMSLFLLPLIAALVAGDIVAAEDGNGTLKTILTRSVDRGQIFAAKVLAAATYAALAVFLAALVATLAGVIIWGFHPLTSLSGTVVSAPKSLALIAAANAFYLIPLFAVVSIGILLSTVSRNSAGAVVGTLGVTLVLAIVGSIPGLGGLRPYLLTTQYSAWQGLLHTPTDWTPIVESVWVCALYAVPCLLAAYLVFLRRDVAGG